MADQHLTRRPSDAAKPARVRRVVWGALACTVALGAGACTPSTTTSSTVTTPSTSPSTEPPVSPSPSESTSAPTEYPFLEEGDYPKTVGDWEVAFVFGLPEYRNGDIRFSVTDSAASSPAGIAAYVENSMQGAQELAPNTWCKKDGDGFAMCIGANEVGHLFLTGDLVGKMTEQDLATATAEVLGAIKK